MVVGGVRGATFVASAIVPFYDDHGRRVTVTSSVTVRPDMSDADVDRALVDRARHIAHLDREVWSLDLDRWRAL